MLPSPPAALLALALLSARPVVAEPPPLPSCESGVRYIELVADAIGKPPEVCIRPGRTTTFLFDAQRVRVEVEGRERFRRVKLDDDTLTLQPSKALLDGERLLLTVYFGDGAAPESSAFMLVVHPFQAEGQVEVSRHPRPVASYQEEAQEARAEARRCQREKAHLQAECRGRGGLTGLFNHGLVGLGGVSSRDIRKEVTGRLEDTLAPMALRSYCSTTRHKEGKRSILRAAVELELMNMGTEPWEAVGAALIGPKGEALRVLAVWQSAPMQPGGWQTVVVEVEATEGELQGPFTLKLWAGEEEAQRVTFRGVTFP